MKEICIKYNPYLVTTDVTVDGKKPKQNSSLVITRGTRLQEWVERLPSILLDEYKDANVSCKFIGTETDFEDLRTAMSEQGKDMLVSYEFDRKPDVSDAEKSIDEIFDEIQKGPVPELRDPGIISAFDKAKNQRFEVNVVALMSSGKSTLINSMLGYRLLPAANEATTANIVRIIDTDSDHFSAMSYDKSGHLLETIENVTLDDMFRLNEDKVVSNVDVYGPIPFVSSVGMRLVFVDTPGPNNSRNKKHEETTYKMLSDSDKSLVLFVVNGDQIGINDETVFLDYICSVMQSGGRQARERFLFAVNKMDSFKPDERGPYRIGKALGDVKVGLEGRGIFNPNIFPVTALPALEKRMGTGVGYVYPIFKTWSETMAPYHFEKYYDYSHLPLLSRHIIEEAYENADGDGRAEIHTGIPTLEQAIKTYINKYARTTKVYDLVQAFNSELDELAARAKIEEAIRMDRSAKEELEKQIAAIQSKIESAQKAQTCSKRIDGIDLTSKVEKDLRAYLEGIRNIVNAMISNRDNKVEKAVALKQCEALEAKTRLLIPQIKAMVETIVMDAYKKSIIEIVEEYKKYLADLNLAVNARNLDFAPFTLVSGELANLSSIIESNTESEDEGYYMDEVQKTSGGKMEAVGRGVVRGAAAGTALGSFIPGLGNFIGAFGGALVGAIGAFIFSDVDEPSTSKVWVDKYVDYVDMAEVASSYLTPFLSSLKKSENDAVEFVKSETDRLKSFLKEELVKINMVLKEKLESLSKTQADADTKAEDIKTKQENLRWLESIQERVNQLINY